MTHILISYLIFPGFLFTSLCGIFASFIERKLSARIQWRRGPPLLQPLYDFIKLLNKETIVPQGASKFLFLISPLVGLAATIIVSTLIWSTIIEPEKSFVGDIIVVLYLLSIFPLSIMLGGFASANPLASQGASREMKLILAYELPLLLSILACVIYTGSIKLGEVILSQQGRIFIFTGAGLAAFLIALLAVQAKLGFVPFDVSEAEQEIMSGPLIEYSGPALGIYKLTKCIQLFVLPIFLVSIFMPSRNILKLIFRYLIVLILIVLLKNTNPRLRIDQAVKFFWSYGLLLGLISVVFAFLRL